jgi:hypothetical protein
MRRSVCPRAMISDNFFDLEKLFVNISRQSEQYAKGKGPSFMIYLSKSIMKDGLLRRSAATKAQILS